MRTFFSIFSLVGFIASVLVHLTTFLGVNPADHLPWVWFLHVGVFVAIIPLIGKNLKQDVLPLLPLWGKSLLVAFMVYAVGNFVLFLILSGGVTPDIWDGNYVLHDHGNLIRELSESEYQIQKAYVLRGFSGHWMLFYLAPWLYSWYRTD